MDLIPAHGVAEGQPWQLSCGVALLVDVGTAPDANEYERVCAKRDGGQYAFHIASLNKEQEERDRPRLEAREFEIVRDSEGEELWVKNPSTGNMIALFVRALRK